MNSSIYCLISIATILCLCVTGITGYTVSGNKIIDPNGKQVMIKGVNRPSNEWSATGQFISLADFTLMKTWGANCVRLPTNQDFWLDPVGGAAYQASIAQQCNWIIGLGMGCLIDLHWNNGEQQNMADRKSITYWSQVAAKFKSNPWIMFELYNEPHDVSWSQWLNGDSTYAGMQEMYNAIRSAGAQNLVVVGGLNWAFDLSGVGLGYAVTGTNIAYATHPYDYPGKQAGDWDAAFGYLASSYPVIMTEYGQYCAVDNYVSDLLAYAQSKGVHWTAWAWWVGGCSFPSIISDWSGTPIAGAGELVKAALSGSVPSTGSSSPSTGSSSASSSGSSTPPTSAPSGPVNPASGSLSVFNSALGAGWQDWGWATRSLASTAYVMSGTSASIMFNLQSYGGIYFHNPTPFNIGSYNTVQFYVNGGTNAVPASSVSVQVYGVSDVVGSAVVLPASIPVSQWSLISIPISSFGLSSSTQIYGIAIKSNVAGSAVVYVSNINFVPSGAPASTQAPTSAPTNKPTTAPTSAPTNKPTNAPTSAPTNKPTNAPTNAPTNKPTTAPTNKPTNPPTSAPTNKPTTAPTNKPSGPTSTQAPSSGCDSSSVTLTHTATGSWNQGNQVVTQFNLAINHNCPGKKLAGLTLSASNWNALSFWNINIMSSANGQAILSLPPYISSASLPFTIGYQNVGGQADFVITSVTFQ